MQGYKNGEAFDFEGSYIGGGLYLAKEAAEDFLDMVQSASKVWIPIHANSAFRTNEKQKELYELWLEGEGNRASKPGFSNHQSGIDVDINRSGHPEVDKWLLENAQRFGFFRAVKDEAWHWEWKGRNAES